MESEPHSATCIACGRDEFAQEHRERIAKLQRDREIDQQAQQGTPWRAFSMSEICNWIAAAPMGGPAHV